MIRSDCSSVIGNLNVERTAPHGGATLFSRGRHVPSWAVVRFSKPLLSLASVDVSARRNLLGLRHAERTRPAMSRRSPQSGVQPLQNRSHQEHISQHRRWRTTRPGHLHSSSLHRIPASRCQRSGALREEVGRLGVEGAADAFHVGSEVLELVRVEQVYEVSLQALEVVWQRCL